MKDTPKVYVVAITVPGDFGGGEIRNYNLIKQLVKQIGADLEVFCISFKKGSPEDEKKLFESKVQARCHIVVQQPRSTRNVLKALLVEHVPPYMYDFRSSGVGDAFRAACEKSLPDVVQIEGLQAYYCVREHISWLKSKGVKIVLDCHNIEYQLFHDMLGTYPLSKRITGRFLTPYLKSLEIEATKQSDLVLTCSAFDAAFFKAYNPNTYVISNGVDCEEFKPSADKQNEKPVLVFVGGVGYPPNVDAMQFYLSLIHPKVKEQIPGVELLIIGTDKAWIDSMGLSDPMVKPLGFVDDIRPYLAQATIGICPLRYGAGTRLKILTYMAAGLPVVSTRKGAENVGYTDGHNIVLVDEPEKFADAILKMLQDPAYRNTIAENGHDFILKNYDWDVIGEALAKAWQSLGSIPA